MIFKVSKFNGTLGIKNFGNPPLTLARSPTLGMLILKIKTKLVVNKIATNVAGNAFVILGNSQMTDIVKITNPIE